MEACWAGDEGWRGVSAVAGVKVGEWSGGRGGCVAIVGFGGGGGGAGDGGIDWGWEGGFGAMVEEAARCRCCGSGGGSHFRRRRFEAWGSCLCGCDGFVLLFLPHS